MLDLQYANELLDDEDEALKVSIKKLDKDLRLAAKGMSDDEARYLVDTYYAMQKMRITCDARMRSMENEPVAVIEWTGLQSRTMENQIKISLDVYTYNHPTGEWLRGVKGIGPVIAAGLLAHIDINKAPTVGHIWRFAGLDPTTEWKKGQRRPWNAQLKTLCWKAGESFVKVSNSEGALYGGLYRQRKALEQIKNDNGDFAEQARERLERFNIGKTTDAYKAYSQGKLPPAHIHARARRYAVKQFLSDLHAMMYRTILHREPPLPYPIAILGHAHHRQPEAAE